MVKHNDDKSTLKGLTGCYPLTLKRFPHKSDEPPTNISTSYKQIPKKDVYFIHLAYSPTNISPKDVFTDKTV